MAAMPLFSLTPFCSVPSVLPPHHSLPGGTYARATGDVSKREHYHRPPVAYSPLPAMRSLRCLLLRWRAFRGTYTYRPLPSPQAPAVFSHAPAAAATLYRHQRGIPHCAAAAAFLSTVTCSAAPRMPYLWTGTLVPFDSSLLALVCYHAPRPRILY